VIDVAITPNRQDAMGVHGIARDLAAAGLGTLKPIAVRTLPALPCPSRSAPTIRRLPRFLRPGDPRRQNGPRPPGCSSG
jgi:phenylalanyl-tRNA synthetase beta subunit